jgi:ribosomal protein S18 acetylase RimI-like enzyme
MNIRSFAAGDEEQVMQLWNELLFDGRPHNTPAHSLQLKLAKDPELLVIAELEGRIIGTAMGGYDGHRGWIYSVAVKPECQRHGVGRALLQRLETLLIERGAPKINLQVRTANDRVVGFYERLGYVIEPRVSMGKVVFNGERGASAP